MLIATQDLQDLPIKALTLPALDRSFPLTDITQSIPQLSDNVDSLQTPISDPIAPLSYSESDYDWLVDVLDTLIKFVRRDENWSVPELGKNDYDWAHALLIELVGAVGESETHPLRPSMEFVCRLVANYEDKYVPELIELFPELAEEDPIETASKSRHPVSNIPKQNENELAAHAFFSIGYFLYHGNKTEKALSAYDTTIALKPNSWEAFYNRGIARYDFKQYAESMTDFSKVIELNHNFASAYHNRGVLKSELKDYEGAIANYTEASRINPNFAEAYANRGEAKVELGRIDEARLDFQKALKLSERQGNNNLKAYIEERLQELNNSTPQDSEN